MKSSGDDDDMDPQGMEFGNAAYGTKMWTDTEGGDGSRRNSETSSSSMRQTSSIPAKESEKKTFVLWLVAGILIALVVVSLVVVVLILTGTINTKSSKFEFKFSEWTYWVLLIGLYS